MSAYRMSGSGFHANHELFATVGVKVSLIVTIEESGLSREMSSLTEPGESR
jgi:hypothetical protein